MSTVKVDKVALGHVSLPVIRFTLVNIDFTNAAYWLSCIYHWQYTEQMLKVLQSKPYTMAVIEKYTLKHPISYCCYCQLWQ